MTSVVYVEKELGLAFSSCCPCRRILSGDTVGGSFCCDINFLLLDGSVAIPSNEVVNASAILKTHGTINRQTPNFLILRDLPGILPLKLLTELEADSIFDGCVAMKPVFKRMFDCLSYRNANTESFI